MRQPFLNRLLNDVMSVLFSAMIVNTHLQINGFVKINTNQVTPEHFKGQVSLRLVILS